MSGTPPPPPTGGPPIPPKVAPAAPLASTSKVPLTGTMSVLQYTGLPPSVLKWRPRLPSRNWSIFLTVVGGTAYLYWDDRRKCSKLKQEYADKVKHLADEPMSSSLGYPRKVTVYAAKWPEDDDYERGLQYFKRYLKPVLVAAAVDYELVTTGQYGSLTRLLQDKILARRRQALGLEPVPPTPMSGVPGQLTPEQKLQRETEGGVVIIGRHTLKEYMEGLKRGWMGPVFKVDREGDLARKLEFDDVFEAKPTQEDGSMDDMAGASATSTSTPETAPAPPPPPASSGGLLGGLGQLRKHSLQHAAIPPSPSPTVIDPETRITPEMNAPPSPLPPQPPMLLVPWINNLGFKQLPYMFIGLFTEHKKVKEGGEAALKLILGGQRDFVGREAREDEALALPSETATGSDVTKTTSDLDFDVVEEGYYKKDFKDTLSRIEKNRTEYYENKLKPKLQATRELASGREPTKEELSKPPPSEADLRKERQDKEFTWTKQAEGYEIVKKGSEVPWDERWKGWLKVYTEPEHHDVPMEGL